ncbi:MAG: hypothetical protein LBT51_10125 [Fusobacteriaceae bacterium]|jgi:hypothetical protein|nr:hypothetical protein [Fusobacteriaceae bacterium]
MRLKKMFALIAAIAVFSACELGAGNTKTTTASTGINLTEEELKVANGNSNVVASILVKKAILEEIKSSPFTDEEKKLIADAKENIEVEAFLNKLAQANVVVREEEVLKVYEDNKEKLGADADVVSVMPQIKQLIFNQRLGEEKVKLVNSFIAKYNLNDVLKKYVPQASEDTLQQANPEPVNPGTIPVAAPATTEAKPTETKPADAKPTEAKPK